MERHRRGPGGAFRRFHPADQMAVQLAQSAGAFIDDVQPLHSRGRPKPKAMGAPFLRQKHSGMNTGRSHRAALLFESIVRDFRFGFRRLARMPGFTLLAVVTLTIGVGANTLIFSVLDDLLIRPSMRNSRSNLVSIHTAAKSGNRNFRP